MFQRAFNKDTLSFVCILKPKAGGAVCESSCDLPLVASPQHPPLSQRQAQKCGKTDHYGTISQSLKDFSKGMNYQLSLWGSLGMRTIHLSLDSC